MSSVDVDKLMRCFDEFAPRMSELSERFYGRLFNENPSLRPYYPISTSVRRHRLLASLTRLVHNLSQRRPLSMALSALEQPGPIHPSGQQRAIVRETLIEAMAEVSNNPWTADMERSWREALRGNESAERRVQSEE